VTLKWILKYTVCDDVDWINLTQAKIQLRALVNTVMPFGLHKSQGVS